MSSSIHQHKPKMAYRKTFIFLFFGSLIIGLWVATQYFAAQFKYHPALGWNYGHLYAPWMIIPWYFKWEVQFTRDFEGAIYIGSSAMALCMMFIMVGWFMVLNSSKSNPNLYGSARWAKRKDIEQAGLTIDIPLSEKETKSRNINPLTVNPAKSQHVYVGGFVEKGKLHYLTHSGPEHVLTYAPTRSGKGIGLVLPTLLEWGKSCVITDLKGELWELTAGWRKYHGGNQVLRFEPASSLDSVKWNPLDEIRIETDDEVGDVQNLVTLIVDPDGKGMNDHWSKTAYALLTGMVLHALYDAKIWNQRNPDKSPRVATLAVVDQMLADPNRDIKELWQEMIDSQYMLNPELNDNPDVQPLIAHPVVAAAAKDMKDRPKEEAGSVLSTAKSFLALYRDPVVARNTNSSDFCIRDLMNYQTPVSLYIVTNPNDKDRLRPLVRVLISMILRKLTGRMHFKAGKSVKNYKHRLLMMLDEFPSMGKLDIMQESLAFVAGYGIKCYLITQDLKQLKDRERGYGQDESITSNCHIQNAYPPNNPETAEYISKLTGTTTVIKEQITTSGRRAAAMHSQVSRTLQETQRALLTVDEVRTLAGPQKDKNNSELVVAGGEMLVFVAGFPAIRGQQLLYFKDYIFNQRIAIAAPKHTDKLNQVN